MSEVRATTVPFTTREWNFVKNAFRKNGQDLQIATEILDTWKARQGNETYLIFQITDHLLNLDRLDAITDRRDSLQVKTLINNYCTVLIRVINYVNEICQAEMSGASIAVAVKTVGIPDWIVELRHTAAHRLMPKMCMLRKATAYIRGWLWERYWSKSVQDAMQWATPKVVLDEQVLKTQGEKKKIYGYELISDYVTWRNEDPSSIGLNAQIRNYKELVEFLRLDSKTLISILALDALILPDEKLNEAEITLDPEKSILRISKLYQLYWAPLISLIHSEHQLLSLLTETVSMIVSEKKKENEKRQLAGWVELYIGMMSAGTVDYATNENRFEWRILFKKMLNKSEYFTEETVLYAMKNAGIFSDKKVEQVEKLMRIGTQIGSILGKRFSDGQKKMNDVKESISISRIIDINEGQEWAISDVDFTDTPLGLMPDQTCDSLYLIIH